MIASLTALFAAATFRAASTWALRSPAALAICPAGTPSRAICSTASEISTARSPARLVFSLTWAAIRSWSSIRGPTTTSMRSNPTAIAAAVRRCPAIRTRSSPSG